MTHNQIAYLEYREKVRTNQAQEAEMKRYHDNSIALGYVQSENSLNAAAMAAGATIQAARMQQETRMAELEQTRIRDLNNYNVGTAHVFFDTLGTIAGVVGRLLA